MSALLDWLFGCRHKDYTFPRTVRRAEVRSKAASITGTYVVCLECGKEMAYDWQRMRVVTGGKPARKQAPVLELNTARRHATRLKDSTSSRSGRGMASE